MCNIPWFTIAGFENGGRGHKPRNADVLTETDSPQGLQMEHSPADTLILA